MLSQNDRLKLIFGNWNKARKISEKELRRILTIGDAVVMLNVMVGNIDYCTNNAKITKQCKLLTEIENKLDNILLIEEEATYPDPR